MNHAIQLAGSSSQLALPMKRRRGRPRKDQNPNYYAKTAQAPPGIGRVKESAAPRVEKNNDSTDGMVGQTVTGIIEAAFDAGFLLSVRIGESDIKLRGIVFKPGHYVPITAENDIAPHVQMIQRNETRLPMENQRRQKRRYRRRSERDGSPSKDNQLSIVLAPSVPPVGARGTLVPVVLQPANLTNGSRKVNQEPPMDASQAYMEALRDKDVHMVEPLAMLPPERPTTSAMAAHEALSFQRQNSHSEASEDTQNKSGSTGNVEHGEETNPKASSSVGVTGDGSDRIQGYPQPPEKLHVRREIEVKNEPPSTKPVEALHSNILNHAKLLPNQFMHYGSGKMTELLQAMQENKLENNVHAAGLATGLLNNESSETKFPGSNNGR